MFSDTSIEVSSLESARTKPRRMFFDTSSVVIRFSLHSKCVKLTFCDRSIERIPVLVKRRSHRAVFLLIICANYLAGVKFFRNFVHLIAASVITEGYGIFGGSG